MKNLVEPLSDIAFTDLFELQDIQELQDTFAIANQVALLLTLPSGTSITQGSNLSSLSFDVCAGLGLLHTQVHIIVEGKHVANWIVGQVRDQAQSEEEIQTLAASQGFSITEIREKIHDISVMEKVHFEQIVKLLKIFTQQLSEKASLKLQKKKAIDEVLTLNNKLSTHIPGAVYQYQQWPDGRASFPYASVGIKDIYGVLPEDVVSDATPVFNILHPDDIEHIAASIEHSAVNLTPWNEEYRVNLPNSEVIWVEADAIPERQLDGSTLWHGYINEITHRHHYQELNNKLSGEFAHLCGAHFFTAVCHYLTELMGLDYVFVGVAKETEEEVDVLGGWGLGEALPVFSYGLNGTPCEQVMGESVCIYPKNICAQFPNDQLLKDMSIESYIGVPLFDSRQGSLGILVVLNKKEISHTDELLSLLELVSPRVSSEILRDKADTQLKKAHEKYQHLVEDIGHDYFFYTHDLSGVFSYMSSSVESMLGWSLDELMAHYSEIMTDHPTNQMANEYTGAGLLGDKQPVYLVNVRHKNGGERWLELNETPRYNANGAVIGLEGIAHDVTERKQAEDKLEASEARWRFALEGAQDGVWEYDIITQENTVSKQICIMLGLEVTEDSSMQRLNDWEARLHPDCITSTAEAFNAILENKTNIYSVEHQVRCEGGHYIWLLSRGMVVSYTADKKPLRIVGTSSDITLRKKAEEKLKLAASVFTHAREGIMITDADGAILEVNDTFSAITGYSYEEVLNRNPSMLKSGRQSDAFYKEMWAKLLTEGHWEGEVWNRRKNGEVYAELLTSSAVYDEQGEVSNYVALFTDVTLMKEHQDQLEHIAHYDLLTQLPNRVLLADRLAQAMMQSHRRHQSLAVVFIDLDGFKAVNDNHGHDVGDELLIIVSQRMNEALREGDTLSRIGGDEFVAILVDLDKEEDCKPVLERLLLAASSTVVISGIELRVSASIGVTISPQDSADVDELMRHADQAMYIAKQSGKNRYHLFDIAQDQAVKIQRESLESIRAAIDKREFILFYQPKVNMKTGLVIGMEALIRWQHPERGLVSPIDFLPVIEDHQLSVVLGEYVIRMALDQLTVWQNAGIDMTVSVNISARQLQQGNFTSRLADLLSEFPQVKPECLELEVLETSALQDIEQISEVMSNCQRIGLSFALDDFGTGYSSLAYLRRLPAELIKIDQSFVRDMIINPDDKAIVEGVIGLAKVFKREVIAEGVETRRHGDALLALGCELAQGYGIAKPMPAEQVQSWVKSWHVEGVWSA